VSENIFTDAQRPSFESALHSLAQIGVAKETYYAIWPGWLSVLEAILPDFYHLLLFSRSAGRDKRSQHVIRRRADRDHKALFYILCLNVWGSKALPLVSSPYVRGTKMRMASRQPCVDAERRRINRRPDAPRDWRSRECEGCKHE
jgi:hypothetical protein